MGFLRLNDLQGLAISHFWDEFSNPGEKDLLPHNKRGGSNGNVCTEKA